MAVELAEKGRRIVNTKLVPLDEQSRRRAIRNAAAYADDANDFLYILDLLGLDAEEGREAVVRGPEGPGGPEVYYRLVGMPEGLVIPMGSVVEFVVTEATPIGDDAIGIVMRYEGHTEQ